MGTAALGMAALNANRRFAVAAFAPGAAQRRAHRRGARRRPLAHGPVQWLAYGALVGGRAAGRRAVAGAPPHRLRRAAPRFAFDADVRRVLRRIAPLTFGIGIYYIDLVVSPPLPVGARAGRAELLLVGDAPVRLPAGDLRHGAVDGGAALAVDARREAARRTSSRRRGRTAWGWRCSSPSRRAWPSWRSGAGRGDALPARRVRRGRGARDGAGARVAGRRHLDGRGRAADRARVLRARRHAHARRRERDRPRRAHRARADCCGARWGTSASARRSPARARCRWSLLLVGAAAADGHAVRTGSSRGRRRARSPRRSSPAVAGWGAAARRRSAAQASRGWPPSPSSSCWRPGACARRSSTRSRAASA